VSSAVIVSTAVIYATSVPIAVIAKHRVKLVFRAGTPFTLFVFIADSASNVTRSCNVTAAAGVRIVLSFSV
jgi:hypothetical protein